MQANEYQKLAMTTAALLTKPEMLENAVLGLNGESGEIADILKKHKFQGHALGKDHLAEELGDVLWYCAMLATGLGIGLDEVMRGNIQKLRTRYPAGFESDRSINRG